MSARPTIDVSHLPASTFGSRDPLWWGVAGLMAIEGTVFALLWVAYLYVRRNVTPWPPTPIPSTTQWLAAGEVTLLLLSVLPMHHNNVSAKRSNLRGMRWGLALATVCGLALLVVRGFLLAGLPFRWDSSVHGSVVWMLVGLHTVHVLTGCVENLVFIVLLLRGPVEEKHLVDANVGGLYWYFVVVGWLPSWALLFLDPLLMTP